MRGRRRERLGSRVVHNTNLRSVGEQNRCQVGPTILFECPAQIPRSSLRSFSLCARPSAATTELHVLLGGAALFLRAGGRGRGGGGRGGEGEGGGRRGARG